MYSAMARCAFQSRLPARIVCEFPIQRGEEALGHGIVPAVAAMAHSCLHAVLCEKGPVGRAAYCRFPSE
jgi:hypothetical protein